MFCKNCGNKFENGTKFCGKCGVAITPISESRHTSLVAEAKLAENGSDVSGTEFPVAPLSARFLNYFGDRILSIIFATLLFYMGAAIFGEEAAISSILMVVGFCGYYIASEHFWQKTPMKFITRTKVVMNDGSKPDLKHLIGRFFARLIPFDQFSIFRDSHLCWHDTLSSTKVVSVKKIRTLWLVLGIAGILFIPIIIFSVIVILTLNPAELLKQARDSNRMSDLATLKSALTLYAVDSLGPAPCETGKMYQSDKGSRAVDGTGWLPIDLTKISSGSPLQQLPVDPINTGNSVYYYACNSENMGFGFAVTLESKKYGRGGEKDAVSTDGGSDPDNLEVYGSLSFY